MDRTILAGTVEGKNVVAAVYASPRPFAVKFLRRAIKSRVHDEERSFGIGFIDAMVIPWKGRILVRNLNRDDWWIVKSTASLVGVDRLLVRGVDARIIRVAVQEEFRVAEIGSCSQVAIPCADTMPGSSLTFSLCKHSFGGGVPLVVPTITVAGCNSVHGGHHFAKLAGAVTAGAERAFGLVPKLNIIGEKRAFAVLEHRVPFLCGCAACTSCYFLLPFLRVLSFHTHTS